MINGCHAGATVFTAAVPSQGWASDSVTGLGHVTLTVSRRTRTVIDFTCRKRSGVLWTRKRLCV